MQLPARRLTTVRLDATLPQVDSAQLRCVLLSVVVAIAGCANGSAVATSADVLDEQVERLAEARPDLSVEVVSVVADVPCPGGRLPDLPDTPQYRLAEATGWLRMSVEDVRELPTTVEPHEEDAVVSIAPTGDVVSGHVPDRFLLERAAVDLLVSWEEDLDHVLMGAPPPDTAVSTPIAVLRNGEAKIALPCTFRSLTLPLTIAAGDLGVGGAALVTAIASGGSGPLATQFFADPAPTAGQSEG